MPARPGWAPLHTMFPEGYTAVATDADQRSFVKVVGLLDTAASNLGVDNTADLGSFDATAHRANLVRYWNAQLRTIADNLGIP